MLVFAYSPHGISVIRTRSFGRKIANIGRFHFGEKWLWDAGRASLDIYRTMDHTEKREIIGMLDALNQQPIRPITDMKRRWEEIIGPAAVKMLSDTNWMTIATNPKVR